MSSTARAPASGRRRRERGGDERRDDGGAQARAPIACPPRSRGASCSRSCSLGPRRHLLERREVRAGGVAPPAASAARTRRAEGVEPVGRHGQRGFVFRQRLRRTAERDQEVAEQLAGGEDRARRDGVLVRGRPRARPRRSSARRASSLRPSATASQAAASRRWISTWSGPVGDLRVDGRLVERFQPRDGRPRARGVAAARGAHGAGEMGDRLRVGELVPTGTRPADLEGRGVAQWPPLQGVARGHRGQRVGGGEVRRCRGARPRAPRRAIAARLRVAAAAAGRRTPGSRGRAARRRRSRRARSSRRGRGAAAAEASLERIESSQRPSRVKMCDGMCSAWGDDAAIFA